MDLHTFYFAAVKRVCPAECGAFLLDVYAWACIGSSQIPVKSKSVRYIITTYIHIQTSLLSGNLPRHEQRTKAGIDCR
jgi:hypothetical protein